jgi:hypothetical protein
MYYPYFRGKQYELILLRELAGFISDNNIHPIIEPVKENLSALNKMLEQFTDNNVKFTVIINPIYGELVNNTGLIEEIVVQPGLRDNEGMSLGYIINDKSSIPEAINKIKEYNNFNFSLIHYGCKDGKNLSLETKKLDNLREHIFIDGYAGRLYRRHFDESNVSKILIRDGFRPQRNADYPETEHFSDLHITFKDDKLEGFGDFSIVGDEYRESGGPAYAIAIHLTYLDEEEDMHVRHFVSDRTESPIDPAGKFAEALKKLVNEIGKEPPLVYRSDACYEFITLYNESHFPGLGYVKKLSMQHHLELVADYLSGL